MFLYFSKTSKYETLFHQYVSRYGSPSSNVSSYVAVHFGKKLPRRAWAIERTKRGHSQGTSFLVGHNFLSKHYFKVILVWMFDVYIIALPWWEGEEGWTEGKEYVILWILCLQISLILWNLNVFLILSQKVSLELVACR